MTVTLDDDEDGGIDVKEEGTKNVETRTRAQEEEDGEGIYFLLLITWRY